MQGIGVNTIPDTIFWFRRDLRLDDNTALSKALLNGRKVQAIFIFDSNILDQLPKTDKRVAFIHSQLKELNLQLQKLGAALRVYYGQPEEVFKNLKLEFPRVNQVYWNNDYTPYALQRDQRVKDVLRSKEIVPFSYKDHVILEPHEVLKTDGLPYTVFTPYAKKWRSVCEQSQVKVQTIKGLESQFSPSEYALKPLASYGFQEEVLGFNLDLPSEELLLEYANKRDFPAEKGTSRVSLALRFGLVSIRRLYNLAQKLSDAYTTELIWREFYQMILWHFPKTVTEEFKPKYASIPWRNSEEDFDRWKNGETGVALVDAGMRELNTTGFMHNRVRMVVASFLCKNLLINWRWGEAYFAEKLMDYELASNVGGWQWAASCGCDAAPYFRVFNPESQAKRFDSKSEYIRRWVPEFQNPEYTPMVDLKETRKACIEIYKKSLSQTI